MTRSALLGLALVAACGGKAAPAPARAPVATGPVTVVDVRAFDEADLGGEAVVDSFRASIEPAVLACYRAQLAIDPTARGKVKVDVRVDERGRGLIERAFGFAPELDACIAGAAPPGSWQVAVPHDTDGEPTDASFAVMLLLSPP